MFRGKGGGAWEKRVKAGRDAENGRAVYKSR
jgi:hypothetical protein